MTYRNTQILLLGIAAVGLALFLLMRWHDLESERIAAVEPMTSGPLIRVELVSSICQGGLYSLVPGSTLRDLVGQSDCASDVKALPGVWLDTLVGDGSSFEIWKDDTGEVQMVRGTMSGASRGLLFIRVDVNQASVEDLESLPGIGPKTARAIVEFRSNNGPFRSLDELRQVRGVGEKTVEVLRPLVLVQPVASDVGPQ